MTIELITPEEYDMLLSIQNQYPRLTFQNIGYQYIDRNTFSEEDKLAEAEVIKILTKSIHNFVKFDNFLYSKHNVSQENVLRVRFQYVWDPSDTHFTGVGYISVEELLKGFEKK